MALDSPQMNVSDGRSFYAEKVNHLGHIMTKHDSWYIYMWMNKWLTIKCLSGKSRKRCRSMEEGAGLKYILDLPVRQ